MPASLPAPRPVASWTVAWISSEASCSRPCQAASSSAAYANRRVAGRLRDQAIFVDQPLRRAQLAREHVDQAEEAERELQLDEGAHLTGDLNLAGGQGMPGLEVPQLHAR